ncbi:hypothetical protein AX14_000762 [Amanita brunnescens Koide BX004]|nr:hypothetical protein AX14_000762 [Amanita brunnescens Koide BX004]
MGLTWTLECWIVGDPLTERFLVEVNSDKRVKELRQAIKQERGDALGNVKAMYIVLWKVSIPTKWDHWHEKNIREAISQAYPLAATEKLSSVYPTTPEQDHVHVVVWTGTLNLGCWIVAEETRRIFSVTINNTQDVADLQQVIKEKTHSVVQSNSDNALDLMLWKVSISTKDDKRDKNIVQFLEDINSADPLLPTERLSNMYPTPTQQDHLHIIISYPLDLVCWIVEKSSINRRFTITINKIQRVGDLRQLLKEKSFVPGCIEAHELSLWRVSIPFYYANIAYWAKATLERQDQLTDDSKWSDIFVMPPESGHVHIAIWHTKLSKWYGTVQ